MNLWGVSVLLCAVWGIYFEVKFNNLNPIF